MVHGDGWLVPGHGQRAAYGRPDQDGANQTWPRGIGDAIDVILAKSGLFQGGLDQGDRFAYMVPAGELGNDAAVVRMQLDLAVQLVGKDPFLIIEDRDPGFVTGCLYAQYTHC